MAWAVHRAEVEMIGHIEPPSGSLPSSSLLAQIELRLPDRMSGVTRQLYGRQQELEQTIYDLLIVLHSTGVSKKDEADKARAMLGLEPGTRMSEVARP